MGKSNGRIWPYAIGLSITLVFGFCVATIVVTQTANIQESDAYMLKYQDADAKANDLIEAKIAFDKQYNVSFISKEITTEYSTFKYSVSDKNGNTLDNAKLTLAISRPETDEFNEKFETPIIKDKIYSFNDVKFSKPGVWNLLLKVEVGEDYRFYDVKVDTRKNAKVDMRIKKAYEF